MSNKKLFFKKKFNINLFILFIFISFFLILYFSYFIKAEYLLIPINYESYYIIPKDKEGIEIENQNKKGLHLSYQDFNHFEIKNDSYLKYSIQLMSNENYSFVRNKRDKFLNEKGLIFLPDELFIAVLKNNLGNEYLLLYKNFIERKNALNYCNKFVYFVDKCLIVNVENLD